MRVGAFDRRQLLAVVRQHLHENLFAPPRVVGALKAAEGELLKSAFGQMLVRELHHDDVVGFEHRDVWQIMQSAQVDGGNRMRLQVVDDLLVLGSHNDAVPLP
jgi:hypothetical protein